MAEKKENPQRVIEISWEVCNPVGGIYTVLSTHAKQLKKLYGDGLCFIGPDIESVYDAAPSALFSEESTLLDAWAEEARCSGLKIRTGRWTIPGNPLAILVDFRSCYAKKNAIYSDFWNWFGVDSLHAYGDYDEACMFAYSCAEVIRSLVAFETTAALPRETSQYGAKSFVAHFHEWTTGLGLLYCKHYLPHVATVFTTHATSIGRSICGNGKALYDFMSGYHGDQMAQELNMESKHSLEKAAAHQADCFTTVSEITAKECTQLLEKTPDLVTPNGFEDDFVPKAALANQKRLESRARLLRVAEAVFGYRLPENTLLLATGGRYEFRNKGLDVFIESLHRLQQNDRLDRPVLAYILVPADVSAPREEVLERIRQQSENGIVDGGPIYHPYNTHWLNDIENDKILNAIKYRGFRNTLQEKVKLLFVPCYLRGNDAVFNASYYDLLQGFDLTAFLSYYEPWGYTPLESIAFSIPTLTTSLSGFGAWCREKNYGDDIQAGVAVVSRQDGNYEEVVEKAAEIYAAYASLSVSETKKAKRNAGCLSKEALWSRFIVCYRQAYQKALARHKD